MTNRWDETWHRLREWTNGQAPSERLAAQILLYEGYKGLEPSHPLGGKDGTKDAVCQKDGQHWLMAVYFPRGQQNFKEIKKKFINDIRGVKSNKAEALAFVTNQELRLAQRQALQKAAGTIPTELFHLERITAILDTPEMFYVRKQFLGIDYDEIPPVSLGGEGGKAPCAGGGGGSAIGFRALAGDGGPGGNVFFLDGHPGEAPGGGGGGGGAIGDDAVAGEGGGGGEFVTACFRAEDLPDVVDIKVGCGGRGGENGGDGEDGEDTKFGNLLRAKGGKGARGHQALTQVQSGLTESSTQKIRISSALLANYAEIHNGLLYTVGCGWEAYIVPDFPHIVQGYFVFVVEANEVNVITKQELWIKIFDFEYIVVFQTSIFVDMQSLYKIVRQKFVLFFQFKAFAPGIWTVQILAGNDELVQVPFEICKPC
ncbi:MAG: glycine-rich domain-containing protein [Nostoc sp. DedQUE01]|nr:hypothetical protein [Nostoc sp. DedQUE01]